MSSPQDSPPFAWQPLTPPGVAAFARAPLGHLLLVQLVFALVAGGCVGWFVGSAWFPIITQAVEKLPAEAEIRSGLLMWRGESPALLARNRFLGIAVDPREQRGVAPAHVYAQFTQTHLRLYSLLGYAEFAYPQGYVLTLNRDEVMPRWGAWKPFLLAGVVAGTGLGLLLAWAVLAALYIGPTWLLGFFANRDLNFSSAWRLCGAALMPGALLMSIAIVCYGLGLFNLPELGAALVLHLFVGWLYAAVSPSCVAPLAELKGRPKNPFKSSQAEQEKGPE